MIAVGDSWIVDDQWWRDEVSRHYFVVQPEGGVRFTCYYDRVGRSWWAQRA